MIIKHNNQLNSIDYSASSLNYGSVVLSLMSTEWAVFLYCLQSMRPGTTTGFSNGTKGSGIAGFKCEVVDDGVPVISIERCGLITLVPIPI